MWESGHGFKSDFRHNTHLRLLDLYYNSKSLRLKTNFTLLTYNYIIQMHELNRKTKNSYNWNIYKYIQSSSIKAYVD